MRFLPPIRRDGRSRSRGAAAVEFALVLPLFITLMFGMLEYSWYFYQQFGVASAVREGVRLGSTISQTASPDPRSEAVTRARSVLTNVGIGYAGGTVTAVFLDNPPKRLLSVDVNLPYSPLLRIVPAPSRLHYTMTMMLELQ